MPRIIFKCPYIKPGTKKSAAHLSNYIRYVATRDGVEVFTPEKQREKYVGYIAQRPRVEKLGTHGLFTSTDDPLVLSKIAEEVAEHPGNVWLPIISLQRDDADRLGYDSAKQWRTLLTAHAAEIAEAMSIPTEQFRWYAAFHDEEMHPHVHMVCYSADGKSGFLSKKGIARIKSTLAKEIFRQELTEIYQKQTQRRDELNRDTQALLRQKIQEMQSGTLENERIGQLMEELSQRLKTTSGKKQYGYLKPPLKAMVDEIVDELAKDPRVAEAYSLWYDLREEVLRTYKNDLPERVLLSQQKEFKRVKNMVIEEAVRLAEVDAEQSTEPELEDSDQITDTPEPADEVPPFVKWSERYRKARTLLFGDDKTPRDPKSAYSLFLAEALAGNALAIHDLGKMLADGIGVDADEEQSNQWYTKAFSAFQTVERQKPNRYVEYRIGKMHAAGLGTKQDDTAAAKWFSKAAEQRYKYAQYSLAGFYNYGKGVPQDDKKALELYTGAAVQGFPYAAWELGKRYRDGVGCFVDEQRADGYFSMAYCDFQELAKQSPDDRLWYRIGWMLLHGVGTEQGEDAAVEWLEKSAACGNVHAQYSLGKLYQDRQDTLKAVIWFAEAAERGNSQAMYALGKIYLEVENAPAALRWLQQSAELSNQCAQYTLGKIYLRGEGVPQDCETAVHWLTLAAGQGNEYAQYFLDHMNDGPPLFASATRLLHHMGRIFEDQFPLPVRGITLVDSKLRRKIREKKMAHGHKPDDHEQVM